MFNYTVLSYLHRRVLSNHNAQTAHGWLSSSSSRASFNTSIRGRLESIFFVLDMADLCFSKISHRRDKSFRKGFTTRPCVLSPFHSSLAKVGISSKTCIPQDFRFNCNCTLVQFWMSIRKTYPLGLTLVETKVASRPGSPFVVRWETNSSVFKNLDNAFTINSILNEWKPSCYIGLVEMCPFRFDSSLLIAT